MGPMTWSLVAENLRARGFEAVAPALQHDDDADTPFWLQHARAAADAFRATPVDRAVVLVGHSGAGQLLPAIRHEARRPVAAYVFVDAGLPKPGPRLGSSDFAKYLRDLYARGERFPNWTDADLQGSVPNAALRRGILTSLRPQPWSFWVEPVPVFRGWPDAPCAYMRFGRNPAYEDAAAEARRIGWPLAELSRNHFHMLVDPEAVTESLLGLARVVRRTG